MASKAATWIAFGAVTKRSLTTQTPTRACPRQVAAHYLQPLHHVPACQFAAKASRGRKTPQNFFSSNRRLRQDDSHKKQPKRKTVKTSNSLRRVAVEAQRSRSGIVKGSGKSRHVDPEVHTREITAFCAAETYNISIARHRLLQEGYEPDPFSTSLYPQVLHVQTPNYLAPADTPGGEGQPQGAGDVFVFPSGSVVTWNVPEKLAHTIVERILPPAAENGHLDRLEVEDLEYIEDPMQEKSEIVGETIVLGTRAPADSQDDMSLSFHHTQGPAAGRQRNEVDTVLAKIAFSSGLARSTKLAVLETQLSSYFHSTRGIPVTLSRGLPLRFTRQFILRKTGELLSIRAQLNLYSELTDSLPDLFWDSPHELGLEDIYVEVGRALDVGVRIKSLNEKMDYASDIASVLRERLSEKHSTGLEWLIIGLITIEVCFEVSHILSNRRETNDPDSTEKLVREYLKQELGTRREG
ncbi:DUF155-domain-containing protein [Polychaeton citri CBS 116435]|uniref:DUF155-domain-containing protein n=1 Tax=Polychaeton citri CBS 116435 TaxID=1314669 RepID=A0A9P4Q3M4_9PEZI|nr:DUF155-domain-containing protein [Polychaeton citri CBS 116435]